MAPSGRVWGTWREEPVSSRTVRAWTVILLVAASCVCLCLSVDSGTSKLFAAGTDVPKQVSLTIVADGGERSVTTDPVTVAEVLASEGVALGKLDRVEPALDDLVVDGCIVRVVRVERKQVQREIEIPVETRAHFDRRVRHAVTIREGAPGRAQAELEVWTKDGEETERIVISQRVITGMKPRVVVRGTRSLPSRGGQVLYMEATGYDPGPRSCGRYASGRTAIGMRAGRGVVAVDPRIIPLGTTLYVEGYGECVAGDVGGAIKGRRIDLGFDSYSEAMRWGRRTVRVHVLN